MACLSKKIDNTGNGFTLLLEMFQQFLEGSRKKILRQQEHVAEKI